MGWRSGFASEVATRRLSALRLASPASLLTKQGRARRRFNCGDQSSWAERAEAAVALWCNYAERGQVLTEPLVIGDLGAGSERLRPILSRVLACPHIYIPYDLHPQVATTEPLDLAREVPSRSFDLLFCLGVFEYLATTPQIAERLACRCRFLIASYVPSDGPLAAPHSRRLGAGWITHLSRAEFRATFEAAGFTLADEGACDGGATSLWLWRGRM
jgi:hypothetical protein